MPQTTSLLHLRIGLLLQAAGSLLGLVKEGSRPVRGVGVVRRQRRGCHRPVPRAALAAVDRAITTCLVHNRRRWRLRSGYGYTHSVVRVRGVLHTCVGVW